MTTATRKQSHGLLGLHRPRVSAMSAVTEATTIRYLWAAARLSLGWVFLWAFLDKTFGLGHDTTSKQAPPHPQVTPPRLR